MGYIIVQLVKGSNNEVVGANYYAGVAYLPHRTPDGIIWTSIRDEAYEFETELHAQNFIGGEGRLRDCVINSK